MQADLGKVADFLHAELNRRLPARAWAEAIEPPWRAAAPNHGFMLVLADRVVGVQLAFYSERTIGGRTERFCNIAAWCVLPEYRAHGIRLVRAVLSQPGYTFTDLSPSGNVVPLNRKLKFRSLDTETSLVLNVPWPDFTGATRVTSEPAAVEAALPASDRAIYRDHRAAKAAHHLVATTDGKSCYVIFRRDRRKGLPLFASILHVGDREVFRKVSRHVFSHLLLHFAIPATLVEHRIAGFRPVPCLRLRAARAKMYRSPNLGPEQIDYLYSELVSVPW